MERLEDIVNHINIQENFAIAYLDCEPLDVSDEFLEVIQELPKPQQHKYLGSQIRNFLYNLYFKGDSYLNSTSDPSLKSSSKSELLENNRMFGRDWEFYQAIHDRNSGIGYFDAGWEVIKVKSKGSLAVKKQGLTIYIEPKKHLAAGEPLPLIGDTISILMPRNLLEQGYYVAVSNSGLPAEPTACIYFNLDSTGAIALMESIRKMLDPLQIPFRFKVLSNSKSYWRYDSGILAIDKENYTQIAPSLHAIYQQHQEYLTTAVPIFTKLLLPGIGIAETPWHPTRQSMDFGMHRCQIVAQGLLDAWLEGDNSATTRMRSIRDRFDLARIPWEAPYLNPESEDIYHISNL
jgi:hypothetical protein